VHLPDSDDQVMPRGLGFDPRTHRALEHGSQYHDGQAYDQRRGARCEPPPSPAGSECKHRAEDATAGGRPRSVPAFTNPRTPENVPETHAMRHLKVFLGWILPCVAASANAGPVVLDHVWIVTSPGAPERKALESAGFTIAPSTNHHEGQGTSSITVEFLNGYLELIWVDAAVSGTPQVIEKFRQRAQWRTSGWSPIGLAMHRKENGTAPLPWPTWTLPRAAWLREGTSIEMLTPREKPRSPSVFVIPPYLAIEAPGKSAPGVQQQNGTRRISSLRIVAPSSEEVAGLPAGDLCETATCTFVAGREWLLELTLDGNRQEQERDFRPQLPLVVRY